MGAGTGREIRAFRFEESFKYIGNSEKVNPEKSGDTKLRGLNASRAAEEFLSNRFYYPAGLDTKSVIFLGEDGRVYEEEDKVFTFLSVLSWGDIL